MLEAREDETHRIPAPPIPVVGVPGMWPACRRPEGTVPRKLAPDKGRAVSATALAGCGRGRDGRVCGEREDPWSVRHEGATDR